METYADFLKKIEKEKNIKIKVKGTAVGRPNAFNYHLIIIKKGLVNKFLYDKDFIQTMQENQQLIDYQIVKKSTAQTRFLDLNSNEQLPDKVIRVFPVISSYKGMNIVTISGNKIPDVPENVKLVKENIIDKTIDYVPELDLQYYIDAFNNAYEMWI